MCYNLFTFTKYSYTNFKGNCDYFKTELIHAILRSNTTIKELSESFKKNERTIKSEIDKINYLFKDKFGSDIIFVKHSKGVYILDVYRNNILEYIDDNLEFPLKDQIYIYILLHGNKNFTNLLDVFFISKYKLLDLTKNFSGVSKNLKLFEVDNNLIIFKAIKKMENTDYVLVHIENANSESCENLTLTYNPNLLSFYGETNYIEEIIESDLTPEMESDYIGREYELSGSYLEKGEIKVRLNKNQNRSLIFKISNK